MDYVKFMADIKKDVSELISDIEQDLEHKKQMLERLRRLDYALDKALAQTSFKTAKDVAGETQTKEYTITDRDDRTLIYAKVTVSNNEMTVIPAPDKKFPVEHSAVKQFLLGKVLDPPQSEDAKKVEEGTLPPEQSFTYELFTDNDKNLQRLVIKNIPDEETIKRIYGALRWTFGKILRP